MKLTNIYLFNDTSNSPHAGCRAVMRSLRAELSTFANVVATHYVGSRKFDSVAFASCDAVVVNGEGTIHHDSPNANFLMMILAMGQAAGKRTALINAVYQQEKDGFADVISGLDLMTVREVRSAAVARSHGGQPWVFLDSAADCRRLSRVDTPKREISGLVKGGTHPKAPSATWLERLAIEKIDMSSGSFDEIVSMLRRADIYVTGQHHGVYAAALAGIPFVAVVSNSHKIEGLIEWSGLPIPVVSNAGTLQSAIDYARRNRSVFEEFSQFITSKDVVRAEVLSNALLNS